MHGNTCSKKRNSVSPCSSPNKEICSKAFENLEKESAFNCVHVSFSSPASMNEIFTIRTRENKSSGEQ